MSEYITDPTLLAELNGTTSEGYVTDPALLEQLNKKSVKQRIKEEVRSVADQGFTGVTDVVNRGLVGNTLGAPVDLLNLGVKGVHALTNAAMSPFGYENKWAPSEAPVGGGEWFGQQMQNMGMVSPERRPMLEAAAGLAPVLPGAVKGVYNLGKAAVNVPVDVAKGALLNKPGTSLVPIEGNQIYKPEAVDRYMKGYLTKAELQQPENMMPLNKAQQAAVRLSGNQVPTKGKIAEATGERLYQDYTNPISLLTDIGTTALTGIPFHGAKRVGQAAIDAGLSKNLKLDPAFKAKFEADVGGAAVPSKAPYPTWSSPTTPPRTPPPAPPAGGAVAPTPNYNVPAYQRQGQQIPGVNAPQTPAQSNATAMGIAPPMTAEQSGFTQQLNNLAKGPAVPEAALKPAPTPVAELPKAVEQPIKGPVAPTTVSKTTPIPTLEALTTLEGQKTVELVNAPKRVQNQINKWQAENKTLESLAEEAKSGKWNKTKADAYVGMAQQNNVPYIIKISNKDGSTEHLMSPGKTKFKPYEDFQATNMKTDDKLNISATGISKSTGEPLSMTSSKDGQTSVFKNTPTGKIEIFSTNVNAGKTPPGTMSMMEDSDKSKFFNKIKASGEAPLEQSVAKMSQADRNRMEQTLRSEINEKNRNTIQPFLDVFEKYRTKK